jgi:hypothetical protein
MRLFLSALLLVPGLFAGEYSKDDRATLISYLDNTKAGLASTLETVNQEQSEFQPNPNRWSILQILEHLVLTEDYLRGILTKALETGKPVPDSEALPDPSDMDKAIRKGIADRSQKAQAPREAVPEGRYRNRDEAFFDFAKRREKTMELVRTTKHDLRRVRIQSPMGPLDGHQWLLMLAAHTERHAEQVVEVMRHESYPKQ